MTISSKDTWGLFVPIWPIVLSYENIYEVAVIPLLTTEISSHCCYHDGYPSAPGLRCYSTWMTYMQCGDNWGAIYAMWWQLRGWPGHLPSLLIPILRHFLSRQYWHWFLWCWSIGQFLFPRQVYVRFLRTLRLKKDLQPSQVNWP